jgi:hypothetical protein
VVDQQAIESSDSTAPQSAKETIEPKATQQKPAEDTSQNKEKEPPMGEDGQALLF